MQKNNLCILPLGPKNNISRQKSKNKWVNPRLKTISEENMINSNLTSINNSSLSNNNANCQIQPINLSYVTPLSPNKSSFMHDSRQSDLRNSSGNYSINNYSQINNTRLQSLNNKTFIVSNNSHSRSPPKSPKFPPKKIVIRTLSRQKSPSPKNSLNPLNKFPIVKDINQKQCLLRKITILQKRVKQLHQEKQNSFMALIKQNQSLKEENQRLKRSSQYQSKYTQNLSQKMISLSEMGQIDSLRQANLRMTAQIQELTAKISDYSHPFKAIQNQSKDSYIDIKYKQIDFKPKLIPLPQPKEQQQSSISRIIAQNADLSINSNTLPISISPKNQSECFQQAELILSNIERISEENSRLRSELQNKNNQIKSKQSRVHDLEQYVKAINNYLKCQNQEYQDSDILRINLKS